MYADFSQNLVISPGDIEQITTFWSKFSLSLSAVTLKIRSRSQCPNQGFNMTKCYLQAYFGQNQVISSGDTVHNITFWSKFSVFCLQ